MASARYTQSGSDDDRGEVQSAIDKAMQAWMRDNPEDDDNLAPRPKHRKISYQRSGSAHKDNSAFAEDGSMRCNLCSMTGLTKDELRQHINSVHTGGYAYYCTLCTKRFRFKTTYEQHIIVDHVDMAENATFDRRTGHGFDKENDTQQFNTPAVQSDQGATMEVVLYVVWEEEVVTEATVDVAASASVAHQVAEGAQASEEVQPAVNGDINHVQPTYEEIVRKPMPDIPKVQRRIDPVEQSVHISPTLQAPKRRINYTGIRSPAKQIRQEVAEQGVFKYRCNLCPGVEFLHREGFTQHLNTYHTGENKHQCRFCTRRFLIKSNYENHLELDHGRDKFGRELPKKKVAPKPAAQRTLQVKKPTIRVGTSRQVILTDSLHDPNVDVIIDTDSDDRRQAQDKIQKAYQDWKNKRENMGAEAADKTCICPICNVTMANKYKLDKHMQGHSNPKKNMPKVRKCYHCDRVFQEGLQLERHVDAYHTHRCPKCDRVFNNLGDRDLHLVVAHAKKKSGRKFEIREETPPPELEPEVPPKAVKTPKGKASSKTTPNSKSAQKVATGKKRAASPEPRPKMTPTKLKVQLVTKKRGRPKKVVAVKGKTSKKVAQPVKKGKSTKKAAAPAKRAAAPAKKAATPTKKAAAPARKAAQPTKKSTPKGKVYKVEGRSVVWEYFGFYMSGSQYLKDVVICLLCGEEKSHSSDGSTASMRGHIQHQHSDVWNKKFATSKKSGKKK